MLSGIGDPPLNTALPTSLLVVDELGPLELLKERGWKAGLQALAAGVYRLVLVVVRPELLPEARRL